MITTAAVAAATVSLAAAATSLGNPFTSPSRVTSADADWRLTGPEGGNAWSIAAAGDMNANGQGELVVGGVLDGTGRKDVYVVFDHSGPAPTDLHTGTNFRGFRIRGAAANDETGFRVASVGDANSDGIPDIALSAIRANGGAGGAYVVFGSASTADVDLANLGSRGYRIAPAPGDTSLGSDLVALGDVNGDGSGDVALSGEKSRVYIVFGKSSSGTVEAANLGSNGFVITGSVLFLGAAHDVNRDGRADIAVSGRESSTPPFGRQRVAIVYGKTTTGNVDLNALGAGGYMIWGSTDPLFFWGDLTGIGDVNGDGRPEIAVGHRSSSDPEINHSTVYVVYGRGDGSSVDVQDIATPGGSAIGYELVGGTARLLSHRITEIGDVNGDGAREFVLLAWVQENGLTRVAFVVVYGKVHPNMTAVDQLTDGDGYALVAGDTDGAWRQVAADIAPTGKQRDLFLVQTDTRTLAGTGTASVLAFAGGGRSGLTTPDQARASLEASHPAVLAASTPLPIANGVDDPHGDPTSETLQPALDSTSTPLRSTGSAVDAVIATKAADGYQIAGGGQQALDVKPLLTSPSASEATVVNDSAALFANTNRATDTVRRPVTNGVAEHQQIRSRSAPTEFTTAVVPAPDTSAFPNTETPPAESPVEVKQVDATTVAVVQPPKAGPDPGAELGTDPNTTAAQGQSGLPAGPSNDSGTQYDEAQRADEKAQQATIGTAIATISAPKAQDASGREVPVTLSAREGAVTMTVAHTSASYDYPIVASSVTTTRAPSCDRNLTYRKPNTAFATPFKKPVSALPECRLMRNGATDGKPANALNNGVRGDSPTYGLRRNGLVSIADSYGTTIARVKFNSTTNRWDIYDWSGQQVIDSATGVIVGGHACMFSPAHAQNWYITAFDEANTFLRAFVRKGDYLDPSRLGNGTVGRYSTGCGRHMAHALQGGGPLGDPGLDIIKYHRSDFTSGGDLKPNGWYGSYNAKVLGPNVVLPLSAVSTAVRSGGIVMAVLPVSGPAFGTRTDSFRLYDTFGYSDPNVYACGEQKQARWTYGQIKHAGKYIRMWGFIPLRVPEGPRC